MDNRKQGRFPYQKICFNISLAVATALLSACGGGGSSSSPQPVPPVGPVAKLEVSSNNQVALGDSMDVHVKLQPLLMSFHLGAQTSPESAATNLKFNFVSPADANDFVVTKSISCNRFTPNQACTITLAAKDSAYQSLANSLVQYQVQATVDGIVQKSTVQTLRVNALSLHADRDTVASGDANTVTVSNITGKAIDLSKAQFTLAQADQADGAAVHIFDNQCVKLLPNNAQCTFKLQASNDAPTQDVSYQINANDDKLAEGAVSVVRPELAFSSLEPSQTESIPNQDFSLLVTNNSSVTAQKVSATLTSESGLNHGEALDVVKNDCDGINLSAGNSCEIIYRPTNETIATDIMVTAANADSAQEKITNRKSMLSLAVDPSTVTITDGIAHDIKVTVNNNGANTQPIAIDAPILGQPVAKDSNCGNILGAGKSCVNTYQFTGRASQSNPIKTDVTLSNGMSAGLQVNHYPAFYSLTASMHPVSTSLASHVGRFVLPYNYTDSSGVSHQILLFAGTQGLSISRDQGKNWKNLTAADGLGGNGINDIKVNDNSFYVATNAGISVSTDYGKTWHFRSVNGDQVNSLTFSGKTIYAGTAEGSVDISNDGYTWVQHDVDGVNQGNQVFQVVVSGDKIYALAIRGVFESSDGGLTWQQVNLPGSPVAIQMSMQNNHLYLATTLGIYQSADQGSTWQISLQNKGFVYDILFDDNHQPLAAATDTGAYFFTSGDTNNYHKYDAGSGLPSSKVYSLGVDSTGCFYAATSAGLTSLHHKATTWQSLGAVNTPFLPLDSSVGAYPGIDKRINQVNALFDYKNHLYVSTQYNGIGVSDDGGQTWQVITTGNGLPSDQIRQVVSDSSDKLYAATRHGLAVSNDQGHTWRILSGDSLFSVYAQGQNIVVGIVNGGIKFSEDAGATWQEAQGVAARSVYAFAKLGSTLYAGINGDGVYKSLDNGKSWDQLPSTNSFGSINALTVSGSMLYAGGQKGLFESQDNGQTWTVVLTASHQVNGILDNDGILYASTDNGLYKINGNQHQQYLTTSGLPGNSINDALLVDQQLYVGTQGGLARMDL